LAAQPLVLDRLVRLTFLAVMATSFLMDCCDVAWECHCAPIGGQKKSQKRTHYCLARRRDERNATPNMKNKSADQDDEWPLGQSLFCQTSRRCAVA